MAEYFEYYSFGSDKYAYVFSNYRTNNTYLADSENEYSEWLDDSNINFEDK